MRTRRISYHRKFSAELVFSSDRGRTSPTENCHFNLHDVQWQFTAARVNQDRDPLVKLFAGYVDRRRSPQGNFLKCPPQMSCRLICLFVRPHWRWPRLSSSFQWSLKLAVGRVRALTASR